MTMFSFGEGFGIICVRGPRRAKPAGCAYCANPAVKLCDQPTRRGKTCSRKMCASCTWLAPTGEDFCREHRTVAQGSLFGVEGSHTTA